MGRPSWTMAIADSCVDSSGIVTYVYIRYASSVFEIILFVHVYPVVRAHVQAAKYADQPNFVP